ncbi:TonB-dependent receptor [Algoriphagus formosus]|uniref:TonB-dependent receptor n=1 Tax=Algoriphagus formosus TaxID=2007308 RepID=A0A4R5V7Z9_9BACT|nr:TonB-dependent receptor [Algoriphagus aquimaris]TDK48169.1 TonB-dependent receptor [Algoriphagus aquimaris]
MRKLKIFFAALILGAPGIASAQIQNRGEVQDQEFVIRKDRVLTLPNQPRVYEKLPVLPQPKGLSDFNYTVNFYELDLPPVQLKAEPVQKTYRRDIADRYPGFLKAGYGNFASPLLEARLMATEVYDWNYSFNLKHQSFGKGPILGEESKESHTNLGGNASYFLDQIEVFGGLEWAQDSYSFYGIDTSVINDPNLEFTGIQGNVFNTIRLNAGFRDIEKVGPISYQGKVHFQNFKDSYLAKETEIGLQGEAVFRPSDDWSGSVNLSFFNTSPEDRDYDISRNYFAIRPRVVYQLDAFQFTAGLNLILENDSVPGKSSDFRIFPLLKASYQFADEFGFFGEFSGDVIRNTYYSFAMENPFIGPSAQLLNTINNYKVAGGIEGTVQNTVDYRAGIDVSRFNQMHFFVNSGADTSRFELVYDDRVTVFNINAELGVRVNELYRLSSRLDLFQYDMNLQAEAWHRPTWQVGINNQVFPLDGLLIQANLNFMGGIKARTITSNPEVPFSSEKLKTIADLQLKADYQITEKIGVFVEGNNLLNGQNMRWLNYPVRGVQLIGGAWLKF